MSRRFVVRMSALAVIVASSVFLAKPAEAAAAMCNNASSCGICCYGGYQEIENCCISNGCVNYCGLSTSGCCLDGYQINYPEECY